MVSGGPGCGDQRESKASLAPPLLRATCNTLTKYLAPTCPRPELLTAVGI